MYEGTAQAGVATVGREGMGGSMCAMVISGPSKQLLVVNINLWCLSVGVTSRVYVYQMYI